MQCSEDRSWLALTGRGVRIAVIDSGVHARHPHIGGVAGGLAIGPDGPSDDYGDRLGHGTAVAAAIHEKAPDASLYAVKIFDRELFASVAQLVQALEWAVEMRVDLVNLSLGTRTMERVSAFQAALARAAAAGVLVVAARGRWLPGSLPAVMAVEVDWACPRDTFRAGPAADGELFHASGYPRPIPGVPPAHNLKGVSFAVANMTGFVARAREALSEATPDQMRRALSAAASPRLGDPPGALMCHDAAHEHRAPRNVLEFTRRRG